LVGSAGSSVSGLSLGDARCRDLKGRSAGHALAPRSITVAIRQPLPSSHQLERIDPVVAGLAVLTELVRRPDRRNLSVHVRRWIQVTLSILTGLQAIRRERAPGDDGVSLGDGPLDGVRVAFETNPGERGEIVGRDRIDEAINHRQDGIMFRRRRHRLRRRRWPGPGATTNDRSRIVRAFFEMTGIL
jgi:hypothetical protein